MKTQMVNHVTWYTRLSNFKSIKGFHVNSYSNTASLIIEQIDKHAATHGKRSSSKESCKKPVDHDALNVLGNCHSKLENRSSKCSNNKG